MEKLKYGLTFYNDLNKQVDKAESDLIFNIIKQNVIENVCKECQFELMGGFRRLNYEKNQYKILDCINIKSILNKIIFQR